MTGTSVGRGTINKRTSVGLGLSKMDIGWSGHLNKRHRSRYIHQSISHCVISSVWIITSAIVRSGMSWADLKLVKGKLFV